MKETNKPTIIIERNIILKFSKEDKIVITVGFYRGYTGIIKNYMHDTQGNPVYQVKLDIDGKEVWFQESMINYKKQSLFQVMRGK
jgi:hypothetical protein